MKTILSVFFPNWGFEIQNFRKRPPTPTNSTLSEDNFLLIHSLKDEHFIARCTRTQQKRGIYPGMPLSYARNIYPHCAEILFPPGWSKRILLKLTHWASTFSPLVEMDIPSTINAFTYAQDDRHDGFCLDITGSEKLFSGRQNILDRLRSSLQTFGFNPRIAIAPTRGCGWAISRYTNKLQTIIEPQDLYSTLAPLPVASLRIDQTTIEALAEVNISRIQELLSISPHSLRERFGENLLLRLRQALGHRDELITPFKMPPILSVEFTFESPCKELESITTALQNLMYQLSNLLTQMGAVTKGVTLTLERDGLPLYQKHILLSNPSAHAQHLWSLIRPHLEQISFGNGLKQACYQSTQTDTAQFESLSLDDDCKQIPDEPSEHLIDSLIQTLGSDCVFIAHHNPSHIPERAYRYVPVIPGQSCSSSTPEKQHHLSRPSILFHTPQRIHAIAALPDRPPSWMKWADKSFRINFGIGPERIEPEWWKTTQVQSQSYARDYYKVQLLSGAWLWIFREEASQHWFVHGVWA